MLQRLILGVVIGLDALVVIAIVSLVSAIPTYFLWNWLMPEFFAIKMVTFWQAWGVNMLAGILFKSSSVSSK